MFVRKLLFVLLGFKNYLKFISYIFLKSYLSKIYLGEHFQVRFLEKILKSGDVCIDIGANLGYFSIPLSRIVGSNGQVYSVEPVKLFRETLESNIAQFALENVEVMPYALGETDHLKIQMGTPRVDGVVRHGRTEILENEDQEAALIHDVTMMRPETLFSNLVRLDYIKCDVEGYELHIVPHLLNLFEKFKPILEIEVGPTENKRKIIDWMLPLGYNVFYLAQGKLNSFSLAQTGHLKEIELYFLPKEKIGNYQEVISTPA